MPPHSPLTLTTTCILCILVSPDTVLLFHCIILEGMDICSRVWDVDIACSVVVCRLMREAVKLVDRCMFLNVLLETRNADTLSTYDSFP